MTDAARHGRSSRRSSSGERIARRRPASPPGPQEIVVLDYGGQYSQLIARRVRDCGVFSELLPHHVADRGDRRAQAARDHPLRRARRRCTPTARRALDQRLLELGVPVMGICYGMQLLVHTLGGRVEQAEVGEFGRSELHGHRAGRAARRACRASRPAGCRTATPSTSRRPGFTALASSTASPVAARRGRRARHLRHPVPPRGRPHPLRPGDPDALPDRRLRLRAQLVGRPRSSRNRSRASASRSATARSSAASPAASTPRSRRCSCTARSATSSRACSSTTA